MEQSDPPRQDLNGASWIDKLLTRIVSMATDAHGNPLCLEITGGEAHGSQVAATIINQISGENLMQIKGMTQKLISQNSLQTSGVFWILIHLKATDNLIGYR